MTSIIVHLLLFLLIVILKPHVDGRMRCPRMCTGHGMCLEDRNRTRLTNPCECFDGYTGIDCSQRMFLLFVFNFFRVNESMCVLLFA